MENVKEPIRLRQRKTPSGRISLYLDIYHNRRRSYEYLHLYLLPGTGREERRKNRETLQLAETIRAKRVVELRNGEYGFKSAGAKETRFFEYYESMCRKRFHGDAPSGSAGMWRACLKHLHRYEPNPDITFADVTTEWVQGFRDYLETAQSWCGNGAVSDRHLSQNTKLGYFINLRACIRQAFEERIIADDPMRFVEGFKPQETTRQYLTIEEVRRLALAECVFPDVKRAFLFSCLTGLRRSDVIRLRWGDVQHQSGFVRLLFRQKKTGGQEYLDITPQAAALMGERGEAGACVFGTLPLPHPTNNAIRKWAARAGIEKAITFHCARHTFAVMMLDLGADLYTVSKLLGHREIATTQVYAKVLDKNKQAAVSKIPSIFSADEADG